MPVVGDQAALDKMAYIHGNPVRRGLAAEPAHWPYSSARAYEQPDGQDELDVFESLKMTRRAWW